MAIKLGKKAARFDPRTLRMSKYLTAAALPSIGAEVSWYTKISTWPMYMNDTLGDCVPAAAGHTIEQWDFYSGNGKPLPTNPQIISAYEAIGGYVPGNPSTDNGCDMLTAVKYWQKTGIAGHKIDAFVSVNPQDFNEVKAAIALFGNVYLGLQLPISAQGATSWTVPDGGVNSADGQPGSWGGHCVPIMAASPQSLTVITWGAPLKMSHNFMFDYADEAYALLSPDWINSQGVSPGNFNLAALQADLALLKTV
jgi:hypothetical protein